MLYQLQRLTSGNYSATKSFLPCHGYNAIQLSHLLSCPKLLNQVSHGETQIV